MKKYFLLKKEIVGTLATSAALFLPLIAEAASSNTLVNPLKVDSFCKLIVAVVNAVIIIGIPVAVLFIVWAGFKFVFAQGNPGELEKAKKNFFYVIIGLAIFVGASLIASVIVNTVQQLGVNGLNSC